MRPNCSRTTGSDGCNDAILKKVFHAVSAQGYVKAFKKQIWIGTPFMAASKPNKITATLATLLDAARPRGEIKRLLVVPSSPTPTQPVTLAARRWSISGWASQPRLEPSKTRTPASPESSSEISSERKLSEIVLLQISGSRAKNI